MSVPVKIPALGESVTEAIIAEWFKKVGDYVEEDEILAELETDKISVEVPAPVAGVITALNFKVDDTVNPNDVIAVIEAGAKASGGATAEKEAKAQAPAVEEKAAAPQASDKDQALSPAVARLVEENKLDAANINAS